ncbi:DegT/DnrJ/EryC1/StrS family aminotransferase [Polymorphospora lycopeni]|uniref:DegT/DnrJ/EryC1/StrS family aminotransferase n=1 Tax=Polymorphospora lycopeni TaxID=3140240 RepID=A0ABV5CQG3_9ACTN
MKRVPFRDIRAENAAFRDELVAATTTVVDEGAFVLGEQCALFEAEWAAYCATAHAVGVGSGLAALELILRAYDLGPGDEVLVPAYTFIATWLAVSATGATPVPVDVDRRTGNIDPGATLAAVGPRTAAVIAVHLFGTPAPMAELRRVADRHGLLLIEDAAQAHGATYHGRRCGSLADAAAFSFYPTKNLGALGDGGAVTTDSTAVAQRVRRLRNYGMSTRYEHQERGTNSRLDEIQAAMLRVKLRRLDTLNRARRMVAARYLALLADSAIQLPPQPDDSDPVWHIFNIRHRERDRIRSALHRDGIDTRVYYPEPPHESRAYRAARPWPELPVAGELARTSLALPCHPHAADTAPRVAASVRAALTANGRGTGGSDVAAVEGVA